MARVNFKLETVGNVPIRAGFGRIVRASPTGLRALGGSHCVYLDPKSM